MPMSAGPTIHVQGRSLNEYEVGTIFEYAKPGWCSDGRAHIIEAFDRRWLVDTYWLNLDHPLTAEQAKEARVIFVPSEHREISRGDAEVYGEEKVTRITRQHNSYERFYVRADEPTLTELDHYRYLLRREEEALIERERQVEDSRKSIEHFRAQIEMLAASSA